MPFAAQQHRIERRQGFSLIEMLTVMIMIGVLAAIAIPRMRVSPIRRVTAAGSQLRSDLDLARTRALASKRAARIVFDVAAHKYVGYLDDDDDGAFNENDTEMLALQSFGARTLPDEVRFGRGDAGSAPGDTVPAVPVTFTNEKFEFSSRGVTQPFGTRGYIYLRHRDDATAVTAISVSGSGSLKLWRYKGGVWQ